MSKEIEALARRLIPPPADFRFSRGIVTAVNTTAKTATVNVDGGVVESPYYTDRTAPSVNDHVDIIFFGTAPRILGVLP